MAWRNQGITGSNNIPLGKTRRFGGDSHEPEEGNNSYGNGYANGDRDLKRGRSPEPSKLWLPIPDPSLLIANMAQDRFPMDLAYERSATAGAMLPRTRLRA